MKAVVFLNGEMDIDADTYRALVSEKDYVFCADGGARHAKALNVVPTLVMGDMDSIDGELLMWLDEHGVEIRRFSAEKDYSDTELLLDYIFQEGFRDIIVFGGTGGRLDHQLANILLLGKYSVAGVSLRFVHSRGYIEGVREGVSVALDEKQGYLFSFFLLSDTAVVSLDGFRYGLSFSTVQRGATIGLSNVIESRNAIVTVHSGTIIQMIQKDG